MIVVLSVAIQCRNFQYSVSSCLLVGSNSSVAISRSLSFKDPTCSALCSAVLQNSLLISNMTCSPKRGQKRCTPTRPPAKLPTIKSHFLSFVSLPCTPYISATMHRSGRVGRSRATCCHHKLSIVKPCHHMLPPDPTRLTPTRPDPRRPAPTRFDPTPTRPTEARPNPTTTRHGDDPTQPDSTQHRPDRQRPDPTRPQLDTETTRPQIDTETTRPNPIRTNTDRMMIIMIMIIMMISS